jgi:large subunit ribosomal protein L39
MLRNDLFSKEMSKQQNKIGRIEKIEVQYRGTPEDVSLIMNKYISTPFDCAKRKITVTTFITFH